MQFIHFIEVLVEKSFQTSRVLRREDDYRWYYSKAVRPFAPGLSSLTQANSSWVEKRRLQATFSITHFLTAYCSCSWCRENEKSGNSEFEEILTKTTWSECSNWDYARKKWSVEANSKFPENQFEAVIVRQRLQYPESQSTNFKDEMYRKVEVALHLSMVKLLSTGTVAGDAARDVSDNNYIHIVIIYIL